VSNEQEIRILHVIETLEVGGAEAVVANIVNHASPGIRAGVCCLMHAGPIASRIHPGIEIIEMGKAQHGNDYRIPFRLAKILRTRNVDIVQSHDWGTLLETTLAATLAGVTAIHMAHGPSIHYPANDRWTSLKRYLRRTAERLASLKIKCAIAVSEVVRQELINNVGIPEKKVVLIHNGINLKTVTQDSAVKRAELNISPEDILLITVGRLAEIKNYSLLLNALALSIKHEPKLKLIMVGDGPDRGRLEENTRILGLSGRVIFLGNRDDVRDWLAASHIFVLPSFYEGISIALLEAMAAELPVIATRVGGNPEVVKNDVNGLLIESGNVKELSGALLRLARDSELRERMGLAARTCVEAEFDLKKSIRQYENLYRKYRSMGRR
jgi:sugar transferase (PEP-CTERM/EpsH1 system associated)